MRYVGVGVGVGFFHVAIGTVLVAASLFVLVSMASCFVFCVGKKKKLKYE